MLFLQVLTAARTHIVKAMALPFVIAFLFNPLAWSQQRDTADSHGPDALASWSQDAQGQAGSVTGKVVDQSGANIVGAVVKLTHEGESAEREATTDEDGRFVFTSVAPGAFQLKISSPGLASQELSDTVLSGEHHVTPLILMVIPTQVTEVHVGLPPEELATEQIKEQEKQRVLGFVPNFYVSYVPDAVRLSRKYKFELAWKSATDPITLTGVGVLAGIDQAGDRWHDYGQGAQGYGKRYGATYANVFAATFIGGAVMPSILKQDPRYFYKGTGSKRSRILYAVASSVRQPATAHGSVSAPAAGGHEPSEPGEVPLRTYELRSQSRDAIPNCDPRGFASTVRLQRDTHIGGRTRGFLPLSGSPLPVVGIQRSRPISV